MRFLRGSFVLLLAVTCALFVVGCDDVITDPNFHTWCGDQLCSWKLESGQIRKAATWHPKDFGIELLDSQDASHITAISQVATATPACLEFSVIADVAASAQVSIQVDFDADGTVDYEQPIAAVGFQVQKTQITAPLHYASIEFTIAKKGTGRAVLAQMDVHSITTCTAAPVTLHAQALGTSCSDIDHDGRSTCSSGVCCEGVCAECCGAGDCASDAGSACARVPLVSYGGVAPIETVGLGYNVIPLQCGPQSGTRPPGTECVLDDDCASHACDGAVWVVDSSVDGGSCPAPPASAPDCYVSSVHGGRCR